MQVNVVADGSSGFEASFYGMPNADNIRYVQQQNQLAANVFQNLSGFAKDFATKVTDLYEKAASSDAVRTARALLNKVEHVFQQNIIQPIFSLDHLQTAPLVMQRFIMADPVIRDLAQKQRINGYSDTYVDPYPSMPTDMHPDYCMMVEGIVFDDGVGGHYYETSDVTPAEGDPMMDIDEQDILLTAISHVRAFIAESGEDPTDSWKGML